MTKIKVAELFYSLQGEGQYIGTPSIFLRTFGCNFKCAGFSMALGLLSDERLRVNPSDFHNYNDLPLVHTGCDSYASWDPRFKHLSPLLDIEEIVDRMVKLLPKGKFGPDAHLIFTGGEPLLGWQKAYIPLLQDIDQRDLDLGYITFETNGTQKLIPELFLTLSERVFELGRDRVTFSVSAKLPSSGEKFEEAIKPAVIQQYAETGGQVYFKFVVSSPSDVEHVNLALTHYHFIPELRDIPVYIMPAGGTTKTYEENEQWVSQICLQNGWRFSPRLQVSLWKNQWGT